MNAPNPGAAAPVPIDWEAWVDTQSALLGLPIAPEHRPGVLRYLQLVAAMAPRVTGFALTPADESGNVFVPVAPRPADGEEPR